MSADGVRAGAGSSERVLVGVRVGAGSSDTVPVGVREGANRCERVGAESSESGC